MNFVSRVGVAAFGRRIPIRLEPVGSHLPPRSRNSKVVFAVLCDKDQPIQWSTGGARGSRQDTQLITCALLATLPQQVNTCSHPGGNTFPGQTGENPSE